MGVATPYGVQTLTVYCCFSVLYLSDRDLFTLLCKTICFLLTHYILVSTDPTFTVENLTSVLNLSPLIEEDWDNVWSEWSLSLPPSQFIEINKKYKNVKDKNEAAAKYLVDINPNSSWPEVARELYDYAQFEALDGLQKYLPVKGNPPPPSYICFIPAISCYSCCNILILIF